jgi:hypothetical protein
MNKKLLKAIPRSALISVVLVLLLSTIALAATILVLIFSDMNIVPGEQAAEVFLDENATIPVPAVHWGDIPRGSHQEFNFYVKNTGVEDIDATMGISGNVSSFMTYSFTPASVHLAAGEVGQITFSADILPTATLGAKNWNYQVTTP